MKPSTSESQENLAAALAFTLMNVVDQGLVVLAPNGKILMHNRAFLEVGNFRQSLEGHHFPLFFYSHHRGMLESFFENRIWEQQRPHETDPQWPIVLCDKEQNYRLIDDSGRFIEVRMRFKAHESGQLILCTVTKVTFAHRAHLVLQGAEQATGIGTWEMDLFTGDIQWSKQVHTIHQTDPRTHKPNLENGLAFYHPDSLPIITHAVNELIQKGKTYDLRLQMFTALGREIWIRTCGYAQFSQGRCERIFGTIQDVSDEADKLRDLGRFRDIVELAQEGIVETDSAGQIVYANAKLASILETTTEKMIGSSLLSYVEPDAHEKGQTIILGPDDSTESSANLTFLSSKGRPLWCRINVHRELDSNGTLIYALAVISDISLTKERESSLVLMNERLSALINNMPVMILSLWSDLTCEWTNEHLTTETGWRFGGAGLPSIVEQLFSDDIKRNDFFQFVALCPKGWYDFTIRTSSGHEIHTSWAIVKHSDGRRLMLSQNINDRKTLEIEKARTQERMEYILEGAALGSWDWNLQTNAVQFDRRWCEMLGLDIASTAQDLSTWEARVHPADKEQAFVDIKMHLDGKTDIYENVHRMRHANGQWRYILDRGRVSGRDEHGHPTRFTGTHFDMTRQKQIEMENRMIIDALGIGIWSYSPSVGRLSWDHGMHRLHGQTIKSTSPSFEDWLQILKPHAAKTLADGVQDSLCNGTALNTTIEFEGPDGSTTFLALKATIQDDQEEGPMMLFGLAWDRTLEVKTEQSLEAARAKSIQSAKLALLGEMAGGIAHEINNPLTIILGKTDQIRRQLHKSPLDLDLIDNGLGVVQRTSDRIAKIVRGLRSFARHADNDPMLPEDIDTILSDTLELCQERFKNGGVDLRYERNGTAKFCGRSAQISQVVMNLLSNAFDAVRCLDEKWVLLQLDVSKDNIKVSVTDSGQGIPEHLVSQLMKPFFTTKDVGKGTGLGLSIAKSIADEHRAEFFYDPSCKNTRFVLTLVKHAGSDQDPKEQLDIIGAS
jgi:PAS domain S-box-containing protein